MKPTQTDSNFYHQVVDCQWACPAHTPVPEYIRLIASQRYTEAYMVNWESNVFPGILGRVCDRPCEPACRRGRIDEEPVAICRLKRVAADNRGDVIPLLPAVPEQKNGRKIALIGAGPASLTVARDLAPLGYEIEIFDREIKGGGMMWTQIPRFRLPARVLDEEVNYILDRGVKLHANYEVTSLKAMVEQGYDAVFVGTGAPRGRDLDIPGRTAAAQHIHIGIEWLASVAFEHVSRVGRRVIILGGGNTAMDCCRTSRRLGGESVKVVVRSGFDEMKASAWEKDDAVREDVEILNFLVPKAFLHTDGRLTGMRFEPVRAVYQGSKRSLVPTGEPPVEIACDEVIIAVGQENAFPWIEQDMGVTFDSWGMPVVDRVTFQSTHEQVFFGGDAAFGPENIITAVEHGHQAAISIHRYCQGLTLQERPPPGVTCVSQKIGMHEWRYDNDISEDPRYQVPHADKKIALLDQKMEVELGFDTAAGYAEAMRCLNCDVHTVFTEKACIECDACVDICPTHCISFVANTGEQQLRARLTAPAQNLQQPLLVSAPLATERVMVKDEDVCLHCGLCAERCPTGAWDMQKFLIKMAQAC
ncbi:4Fe-4S dicluster domain-containing protein [Exilibacterium tricleocarpae]|uniref:dihydrouracil dehydrogenase (NAD(+)) n=1 Tax=Exilibacterium tricleocarpae TaxID=2591008 RepID=A0A545TS32_9GAMM|nr:FAD-dependent oxidoreductase [Exilibacterium tricleocarpae]TQV80026.1 4Fe-4S dicluster domain-containing protein [Exilibacterium tricleocarpae]